MLLLLQAAAWSQQRPSCSRQRSSFAKLWAISAEAEVAVGDSYEVYLEKPLGLRFARGNDGKAYIAGTDSRIGMTDDRIEVSCVMLLHTPLCPRHDSVVGLLGLDAMLL